MRERGRSARVSGGMLGRAGCEAARSARRGAGALGAWGVHLAGALFVGASRSARRGAANEKRTLVLTRFPQQLLLGWLWPIAAVLVVLRLPMGL